MDKTSKVLFTILIILLFYLLHRITMIEQDQVDMKNYIKFLKQQPTKVNEEYEEQLQDYYESQDEPERY